MVDGTEITDPQKIASAFHKYFVNVSEQVDKEIPCSRKYTMNYLYDKIRNSFFLNPTDSSEIEAIILWGN